MTRVTAAIAIVSATLLGCPGEGDEPSASEGGGNQPGSTSSTRLCDAHLAWDQACAALEPEPREEPYWGETECLMGPWQHVEGDYLDAAATCFDTLSCDSSDDACTAAGLAALGIDGPEDLDGDALLQQCMELAASCEELIDDACLSFAVYTEQGRNAAEACLELSCDAIEACLLDPG